MISLARFLHGLLLMAAALAPTILAEVLGG